MTEMLTSKVVYVIKKPGFWFILILLALFTIPHYQEVLKHPFFLTHLYTNLGIERHAFERILYLAPIVWAGFMFGWRGAAITSFAALAVMLPRAFVISPFAKDAIFETLAVFVIGNVLAFSFESLRKERQYRLRLEETQRELRSNVQIIKDNEKRLAALNQISNAVSQSLDLNNVLHSAIDSLVDVMRVDIVLIFLLDERENNLFLAAHHGVSEEFARDVDRLKIGEGFNGRVAESGQPLFVEDASTDPRLTRMAVSKHEIRSEIIVPLRVKEKVNGTLCAAMHSYRYFQPGEVELLTAIGNQIGVAIENAHLYQKQQETTSELRASEEKYRELFENAHDAIWLHDLRENIIAANKACSALTGYTPEEFNTLKSGSLFSGGCLHSLELIEQAAVRKEMFDRITEAKMIRKDGSEAFVQLSTSPVYHDGQVTGFQHIARDITEQKRMQENMTFYLQQATRAQEDERKRISRELHDETIQELVVLARQIDAITTSEKGLSKEGHARLEKLREQTNSIIQGVRRLSQDLRPAALDRLGLLPALQWLANDLSSYSGIKTTVQTSGNERPFVEEVALVLFRITQEALRNVWRHSGAKQAYIDVEFLAQKTRISIRDNGKGFYTPGQIGDLAREGKLGLAGMQERARLIGATLCVQSEPGKGTTVSIEIPA